MFSRLVRRASSRVLPGFGRVAALSAAGRRAPVRNIASAVGVAGRMSTDRNPSPDVVRRELASLKPHANTSDAVYRARSALVIGVDSNEFACGANNASLIALTLQRLGFAVNTVLNGSVRAISDAAHAVGEARDAGDLCVVYYSARDAHWATGHTPADHSVVLPTASPRDVLQLSQLLSAACLRAKLSTTLCVVDSAFTGPTAPAAPLTAPAAPHTSVFHCTVATSPAPTRDAPYSLYTDHFVEQLRGANHAKDSANEILRRSAAAVTAAGVVPWTFSTAHAPVFLHSIAPRGADTPAAAASAATA